MANSLSHGHTSPRSDWSASCSSHCSLGTRWRESRTGCPAFLSKFIVIGVIEIPYVNVPNDLSKIKTKLAFNLTKRQLVCFGIAAAVGIPSYLLARSAIGNTGAMFLMMGVALPAFLLAMYEKDGLPFEKVVRNILRARFLRPGVRPYQTENIYAPFTQRGAVRKEDAIAKSKQPKARPRKGR